MEKLEERINLSVFDGLDRAENIFVLDSESTSSAVISVSQNDGGEGFAGMTISASVFTDDLIINAKGGNDVVVNNSSKNVQVFLGDGNDSFDGGEGGAVFVDGGSGNDSVIGTSFNDTLIGGNGVDTLFAKEGDDFIFGGNLLSSLQGVEQLHKKIVGIQTSDDGVEDFVNAGVGFDVVFNDIVRQINITHSGVGNVYHVSTTSDFVNALSLALPGDQILLSSGNYNLSQNIVQKLAGVSITGAGETTVLSGGSFFIDNDGNLTPTLIENLVLNLTGMNSGVFQGERAYNIFRDGTFYFDEIEVFGIGTDASASAALNFSAGLGELTSVVVANSYLHNTIGDIVSTSSTSPSGMNPESLVVLYDSVGHTPGNQFHHQVLTAHFGFNLVDVGGHYWDANLNVVAPDSVTIIDLYFTTVEAGARNGGIVSNNGSIIYGANLMNLGVMHVKGTIQNSYLKTHSNVYYGNFITLTDGAKLIDNHIVYTNSGFQTKPVTISGNNAQVVDNVFEDWDNQTIINLGLNNLIFDNVFV